MVDHIISVTNRPKWEHAVTAYNLKGKPDGLVIEKGYEEKYKMDATFSLDNIKQFVADYFDDELVYTTLTHAHNELYHSFIDIYEILTREMVSTALIGSICEE